jgi:hypothetical protein
MDQRRQIPLRGRRGLSSGWAISLCFRNHSWPAATLPSKCASQLAQRVTVNARSARSRSRAIRASRRARLSSWGLGKGAPLPETLPRVARVACVALSHSYHPGSRSCLRTPRGTRHRVPARASVGAAEGAGTVLPRDLQLVGLATKSSLEPRDLSLQLAFATALLLARQRLATAGQKLLAPRVVERLRDLVLPTQLLHRHVAAQPSSTISSFCCTVKVRYLRCPLNPISFRLSGPSCEARRTQSPLRLGPAGLGSTPIASNKPQPGKCLRAIGVQATGSC